MEITVEVRNIRNISKNNPLTYAEQMNTIGNVKQYRNSSGQGVIPDRR